MTSSLALIIRQYLIASIIVKNYLQFDLMPTKKIILGRLHRGDEEKARKLKKANNFGSLQYGIIYKLMSRYCR